MGRGLSPVIASVLMVALVLVLISVIWVVTRNIVTDNIDKSEACFGVFEKVKINERYTCYNTTDFSQFSIKVGDIELDELLVVIQGEGSTKTFTLKTEGSFIQNLKAYGDANTFGASNIVAPGKNEGKTYIVDMTGAGFSNSKPDSIEIIPIIKGKQCESSDTLSEFEDCQSLY